MPRARSLRARLVITVLALFVLACVAIGIATTVALQGFLDGRQQGEVVSSADRFARAQNGQLPRPPDGQGGQGGDGGPGPGGSTFLGPQPPGSVGVVFTEGPGGTAGTVLGAERLEDDGTSTATLSSGDLAALAAVGPGDPPRRVDLAGGEYRASAQAMNGRIYVLARETGPVSEVLTRLVLIEVVVLGGAVLVTGVAAAVLVRREMRPLERVAGVAGRVGRLPLDRGEVHLAARVPDPDPGTEVGQVGAALNRMLDNVEGALAARQDSETRLRRFVADASHELRTPLAAIRGYAELSRRERDPVPPGTAHALTRISSQAERMSALVEDLLLLARLDAGRPLERTEVDLTRVVLDAIGDAHVAGPDHRFIPDLPDEPVTVPGDTHRLAQVVANLLTNARTHTPDGHDGHRRAASGRRSPRRRAADRARRRAGRPAGDPPAGVRAVRPWRRVAHPGRERHPEHRAGPRDRLGRGGGARRDRVGGQRAGAHDVHRRPARLRRAPFWARVSVSDSSAMNSSIASCIDVRNAASSACVATGCSPSTAVRTSATPSRGSPASTCACQTWSRNSPMNRSATSRVRACSGSWASITARGEMPSATDCAPVRSSAGFVTRMRPGPVDSINPDVRSSASAPGSSSTPSQPGSSSSRISTGFSGSHGASIPR